MARTVIATGDSQTVKHYSAAMFMECIPQSFFLSKFIGKAKRVDKQRTQTDPDYPIQILTDLENDAGDAISYDLFTRAKGQGIEGDNVLRGNEEKLVVYTDTVKIDQLRHGMDCGGRMTRKRTRHNLREVAKSNLAGWWAERFDELFMMYLAGERGDDSSIWVLPTGYAAFAGNTLTGPDSTKDIYAGAATTTASIVASDTFTIDLIDDAVSLADLSTPLMRKCKVGGKSFRAVLILHPYAVRDLRTNTSVGQWMDLNKAAGVRGPENPIFSGDDFIGVYNGVAIFKHPKVPYHNDWGGAAVTGARNFMLFAQSGVIAFGSPGNGLRFSWHEEEEDRGNVQVIDTGSMFGVKKAVFNSVDFGVVTIASAASPTRP
jgi:N4-gp56 family major capsid protein